MYLIVLKLVVVEAPVVRLALVAEAEAVVKDYVAEEAYCFPAVVAVSAL